MKIKSVAAVAIVGFGISAVSGTAFAAGDPDAGRVKAQGCMGCHGNPKVSNAYPTYKVPKVGGQHAQYIVSSLKAYQAGDRVHPTMSPQSQSLSDRDMEDIAAYFASLGSK